MSASVTLDTLPKVEIIEKHTLFQAIWLWCCKAKGYGCGRFIVSLSSSKEIQEHVLQLIIFFFNTFLTRRWGNKTANLTKSEDIQLY